MKTKVETLTLVLKVLSVLMAMYAMIFTKNKEFCNMIDTLALLCLMGWIVYGFVYVLVNLGYSVGDIVQRNK